MDKLIIDTAESLPGRIEDFMLDKNDEQSNYTAARLTLCRQAESDRPLLFYSQQLSRPFRRPGDCFGGRHLLQAYTPANLEAAVDMALERKYTDTLHAYKNQVDDYAPLSDIHSEGMALFMDEQTARFVADIGIRVEALDEDFSGIESVPATAYTEDLSGYASQIKQHLRTLKREMETLKQDMEARFKNASGIESVPEESFEVRLAREKLPDYLAEAYLKLQEKITAGETRLQQLSREVFEETACHIQRPRRLERMVGIDQVL